MFTADCFHLSAFILGTMRDGTIQSKILQEKWRKEVRFDLSILMIWFVSLQGEISIWGWMKWGRRKGPRFCLGSKINHFRNILPIVSLSFYAPLKSRLNVSTPPAKYICYLSMLWSLNWDSLFYPYSQGTLVDYHFEWKDLYTYDLRKMWNQHYIHYLSCHSYKFQVLFSLQPELKIFRCILSSLPCTLIWYFLAFGTHLSPARPYTQNNDALNFCFTIFSKNSYM